MTREDGVPREADATRADHPTHEADVARAHATQEVGVTRADTQEADVARVNRATYEADVAQADHPTREADVARANRATHETDVGRADPPTQEAIAPPRVLTVAGSDSGGGAGIQADLKTMLAHGVHGMSVITAVTAQNSMGVQGVWELPLEAVERQFRSVVDDIGVDAVKTGMLASRELTSGVAALLSNLPDGIPVVVDPVSVSKHGDPLLAPEALKALREDLLPRATVATPNLDEVRLITGLEVTDEPGMRSAARRILDLGPRWVLIKGGHLEGEAADLLIGPDREELWLRAPRLNNRHTHGTGCTLASAIASRLALGDDVPTAVTNAKAYVTGGIAAGFPLGSGIGPVDHGWRLRQQDQVA